MKISEYKFTLIFGSVGFLMFLVAYLFNLDLFEKIIVLLEKLEKFEIDEIILSILILFVGLAIDTYRRLVRFKVQDAQRKVLIGVMINVNHVLRNFLNTLYYFKDIMLESNDIPDETVDKLDGIIEETQKELTRIAETRVIPTNVEHNGVVENKTSSF